MKEMSYEDFKEKHLKPAPKTNYHPTKLIADLEQWTTQTEEATELIEQAITTIKARQLQIKSACLTLKQYVEEVEESE